MLACRLWHPFLVFATVHLWHFFFFSPAVPSLLQYAFVFPLLPIDRRDLDDNFGEVDITNCIKSSHASIASWPNPHNLFVSKWIFPPCDDCWVASVDCYVCIDFWQVQSRVHRSLHGDSRCRADGSDPFAVWRPLLRPDPAASPRLPLPNGRTGFLLRQEFNRWHSLSRQLSLLQRR